MSLLVALLVGPRSLVSAGRRHLTTSRGICATIGMSAARPSLHLAALAGRNKIVKFLVLAGASPAAVWLDTHGRQVLPADMATGECIGMPELAVTLGELGDMDIGLHEDPPLVGPSTASTSAEFDFEVSSALGERVLRGKPVSKPLGRTRV